MEIYLDIFFIVNTEVDLLILLLESRFQRRKISLFRLIGSSVLGGIFSVVFLVSGIHRYYPVAIPVYFMGSGLLIRIACGKTTRRAWLKNLLMFYVSAYILAGALMRIQAVWNRRGSMMLLLSTAIAAVLAADRLMPAMSRERQKQEQIFSVRMRRKQWTAGGRGLLDTGNRLRDPFSGKPVSIGNREFLKPFLEDEELVMRYIPFHAVGTENGMLAAFQMDYIEVQVGENEWVQTEKPWIAISDERISADGEFDLILPLEITSKQTLTKQT